MDNTDKAIRRHLLNGERKFTVGRETRTRSATYIEVKDGIDLPVHITGYYSRPFYQFSIPLESLGLTYDTATKTFKEI